MRILYLSCHSILEYDELKIFEELGIEYFSLGSYLDPQHPVDKIRPALLQPRIEKCYINAPDRNNIPKEFFDMFDVVIVMHVPEWIEKNWENMKHKRVIWRTIGQSTEAIEKRMHKYFMQGMEIVRYSAREKKIPSCCGATTMIRFYKDEKEFGNYNGMNKRVITMAQNMKHRAEFCNYDFYRKIIQGLPATLYGPNNENVGDLNGGFLTYDEMQQVYRDNRVYLYTGTQPASYTLNFIEAMMTGIPVVAIGPLHANSLHICGDVYEIPDIISNGIDGYVSDDADQLRKIVNLLLENPELAKQIGRAGRDRAIQLFGKSQIKKRWENFLQL